jgi:ubiquitin carboxyl-terminal hydrolase 16/45
VLYRLTGVVVHSGGLGGGHYIAHVRAGNATEFVHAATGLRLLPDCGTDWYHISDSHAGGGSLAGALAAQAYLLFYERVRTEAEPA